MAKSSLIKPAHKAVKEYYKALDTYRQHGAKHEGAVETAFQRLLADTAPQHGWTLIPKEKLRVGNRTIFPDGTLHDLLFNDLRRGFWEAKDTDDDLDAEISKKLANGYPRNNIIFEDTRTAVLYQGGVERYRLDLTDPKQLCSLLNEFYSWTDPEIGSFHEAVEQFKSQVPELAEGLVKILAEAHERDRGFQAAFDSFFAVCQQTLNPNISRAAVDEMLVQHLLTERLIRKVFDNPEFTQRNVIAAEVEKVIAALVKHSFNRASFLRSLDRFYRAIEDAARTLTDFSEKQHFLNTVYEQFFQGYSVKVADTHGIVYTPQEIVDFMCASVAEVLDKEFGLTLGSPGVNILDPCTGTGNFVVNLINRIAKRDLPRVYKHQLFANEVMLLPYYIAALNIEHAYYERTGDYEAFDGLCFADTLDLTEDEKPSLFTEENTERVRRQRNIPITVIIGNPPYNANQVNENDNNKNRKYPTLDGRIKDTYARDSRATLKNKLYDPYVKFIRWAVDRLNDRDGIICFVTNNSFVHQNAFDGMRKHLLKDFTRIDHVDLHGNVRENPKLSGTTHNVFGIQVGVGITIAIRCANHTDHLVRYHRVPEGWRKEEKLAWLATVHDAGGVPWTLLHPDEHANWLAPEHAAEFSQFAPIATKDSKASKDPAAHAIFMLFSAGVKTNRDEVVYDFTKSALLARMLQFVEHYNAEVDRHRRLTHPVPVDDFVDYRKIKWDGSLKIHLEHHRYAEHQESYIREAMYRPFTKRSLYFDPLLINRVYQQPHLLPNAAAESDNRIIWVKVGSDWPMFALLVNVLVDVLPQGGSQCFPFYVYDKDGTNRRENVTDWAMDQFRTRYADQSISKWDIFYYVYGILHHTGYRSRFADNLKRELPRIPLAPDFRAFATAGQELAQLHLDYEKLDPYPLQWIETEGVPLSYRVEEKMRLSRDKTRLHVNESLTLAGIPPEPFQYRLGNRSALEWVIDQYQVTEDKRSGIRSDPNRPDDVEYIVRLVGQVVRVSLETVRIVASLPERFSD